MSRYIGLDFGTTNSALCAITEGQAEQATFLSGAGRAPTFASVLYFDPQEPGAGRSRPHPVTGPQGIELYLEAGEGRILQSLKSYLASQNFHSTSIFGHRFGLDQLIGHIVRDLQNEAEAALGALPPKVVVGRPVNFARSGKDQDNHFALRRLEQAIKKVGFTEVAIEYEPVAAAYAYQQRLEDNELVLIADFGGGTSDFTLIRVGPDFRQSTQDNVIGSHGVAVAGNAFDYSFVKKMVAPRLGLGSHYMNEFRKVLEIPPPLYHNLEWHRLSLLSSREFLRSLEELERQAMEPEKLEAFVHIVRYNLGYHLYRSVEDLKFKLSSHDEGTFVFDDDPVRIEFSLGREDFEACIASPLEAIAACVDELFAKTGVATSGVDRGFMTGGSSFVPAVQQIFVQRFGTEKLDGGGELTSVSTGLALAARDRFSGSSA